MTPGRPHVESGRVVSAHGASAEVQPLLRGSASLHGSAASKARPSPSASAAPGPIPAGDLADVSSLQRCPGLGWMLPRQVIRRASQRVACLDLIWPSAAKEKRDLARRMMDVDNDLAHFDLAAALVKDGPVAGPDHAARMAADDRNASPREPKDVFYNDLERLSHKYKCTTGRGALSFDRPECTDFHPRQLAGCIWSCTSAGCRKCADSSRGSPRITSPEDL